MSHPEEYAVVALDGGEAGEPLARPRASQARRAAVVKRRHVAAGESRPWDRTRLGPPF